MDGEVHEYAQVLSEEELGNVGNDTTRAEYLAGRDQQVRLNLLNVTPAHLANLTRIHSNRSM